MKILTDIVSKSVERSNKTKSPSKEGADSKGKKSIPNKEINNTNFGGSAFFPGNFGVENVSKNNSNSGRNKGRKPKEAIVIDNDKSNKSIEKIIKNSEDCSDDSKFTNTNSGSWL